MHVFSGDKVLDLCSFRDEDDDCTYSYTVDHPQDLSVKDLEVQVLKKKGELLWQRVKHYLLNHFPVVMCF